ncbi:MAG: hypothetical protein QNL98_13690 [Mycobacterium sp.]
MRRYRTVMPAVAAVGVALAPGVAHADVITPELEVPCSADLAGTMTLLPDGQTYVVCQEEIGSGFAWTAAPVPFEPNTAWLSYGPGINLHGQAMRNPNLSSGQWTATPQDPQTACRAQQQTVVAAGVLAAPQVFQGEPGQPLSMEMLPKLFYVELSGYCLWTED